MSTLLSDLTFDYTLRSAPPDTREYRQKQVRLSALQAQISQALGEDFLDEYSEAYNCATEWEVESAFQAGVQFGIRFEREVLSAP